MGKTLVIAEKPSVGRDLAGALPDSFTTSKDKTHITGENYVITWAIGHLVGLAHVRDPGELMSATNEGQLRYGPGDLEGLARLGSIKCR